MSDDLFRLPLRDPCAQHHHQGCAEVGRWVFCGCACHPAPQRYVARAELPEPEEAA